MQVIQRAAARGLARAEKGAHRDDEGLLVCDTCGERKEAIMPLSVDGESQDFRRYRLCACDREHVAKLKEHERENDFAAKLMRLRQEGISDRTYLNHTFDADDMRDPRTHKACKSYADNWPEMYKHNEGMLLYGDVGTGKTFAACCIANAVLEQLSTVCVTSFPAILNNLPDDGDRRKAYIGQLQHYSLLVIDDLGVERRTEYALEQVFNIVDARARSGKPVIFTTNLSLDELQYPEKRDLKRIYSRVLGMCPIRLKVEGSDRRKGEAEARRQLALEIMGYVK